MMMDALVNFKFVRLQSAAYNKMYTFLQPLVFCRFSFWSHNLPSVIVSKSYNSVG